MTPRQKMGYTTLGVALLIFTASVITLAGAWGGLAAAAVLAGTAAALLQRQ